MANEVTEGQVKFDAALYNKLVSHPRVVSCSVRVTDFKSSEDTLFEIIIFTSPPAPPGYYTNQYSLCGKSFDEVMRHAWEGLEKHLADRDIKEPRCEHCGRAYHHLYCS